MRIAVVIDPWECRHTNGAVISTRRFVRALGKRGFEFSVLCAEGGLEPVAEVDTIRLPRLSVFGYASRLASRKDTLLAKPIHSVVKRVLCHADVLHVQLPGPLGLNAIRHARALGLPVIVSCHAQAENLLWHLGLTSRSLALVAQRLAVELVYNRANLVIAPTSFAANLLRCHGLCAAVRVISNGVPRAYFVSPARRGDGRFRILCAGRLVREKRQETLIRAVQLSAKRDRIDLRFTGHGPERGRLERLARRLGVNAAFGWVGEATLIELYRAADLMVHPSLIELEGMSVIEAMAAAGTVLMSDSQDSATKDFATRPEVVFRADDPVDLAKRIDFWLERDELRVNQGRENQRLARRFAHARSVDALANVYREAHS